MLIVAPTRELAMQSQEVLEEAGKSCNIRREDRDFMKRTYVFAFSIITGYIPVFFVNKCCNDISKPLNVNHF
jgi:superfamily II DNA/RNA helicase